MTNQNTVRRFVTLTIVFLLALSGPMSGWDAGPRSCMHSECTGGVGVDRILDTQPKFAASVLPSNHCEAGDDLYGGVCYHGCPAGWSRTAVCTCHKNGGGIFDLTTDCGKLGASGLPTKGCPEGHTLWGGLCYVNCPAGSERTAVSTCVHDVKWRANTHLWVVDRGIDLLAKSPDTAKAAGRMNVAACRDQWEQGLWDADDGELSETGGSRGSHFYNAGGKDAWGNPTKTVTYLMAGIQQVAFGNARTNAQKHIVNVGNLSEPNQCHEMGLALHYLTDMTQPMHSSSFSAVDIPLALHAVFEDYAGNIQGGISLATSSWDKRWANETPDGVLVATSVKANSLSPGLMQVLKYDGTICTMTSETGVTYTGYCFAGDPKVNSKIEELLRDAAQSAASYIHAAVK